MLSLTGPLFICFSLTAIFQNVLTKQCDVTNKLRFDCHPDPGSGPQACLKRGCCWRAPGTVEAPKNFSSLGKTIVRSQPACYFANDAPGYEITDGPHDTEYGMSASLVRRGRSAWPFDVYNLKVDIYYEQKTRLRFKIYDPNNRRYEVPTLSRDNVVKAPDRDYSSHLTPKPFGLKITRKSTETPLFDSNIASSGMVFADQFLQISSRLGTDKLYGIGELLEPLRKSFNWKRLPIWARDEAPAEGRNGYGSHPFYLAYGSDGNAYGVLFYNSNAMEIELQPLPAVTFRTIGGVLEFYVLTGPTPDDVITQYIELIGRPYMPPYWALGFHLARYGYENVEDFKNVIRRNRKIKIPYEAQWHDIEYMDKKKSWTYDKQGYAELPSIVKDLHDNDQKYVIIVDPCMSNIQPKGTYQPYDEGIEKDIFVKNKEGENLVARVWPGHCVFPDFSNPKSYNYWYNSAKGYRNQINYDSIWIDMNEPASFAYGSIKGCPDHHYNTPPYTPEIFENSIFAKTICGTARQYGGFHYNIHNLYGYDQSKVTFNVSNKLFGRRSLVLSRSSFPGSGVFTSHWTGDVFSNWHNLRQSIPAALMFNMFGIPLVGADVCGFIDDTTEELCIRWMQLGSFYSFMRDHSSINTRPQDPAAFSRSAQLIMKRVLEIRYSLLPYLYTLIYRSHTKGTMVLRPLFFQYPDDEIAQRIEYQFLWGDALLISPVLEKGSRSVRAYFPDDVYYDFYTSERVKHRGGYADLSVPLSFIPLHVRGGSVIAMQQAETTTVKSRRNSISLKVAFSESQTAEGSLYLDDGDSLDSISGEKYTYVNYNASRGNLTNEILKSGYTDLSYKGTTLARIEVIGLDAKSVSRVTLNDNPVSFNFDEDKKLLIIHGFEIQINEKLKVIWTGEMF